jgi:hypothetical protein
VAQGAVPKFKPQYQKKKKKSLPVILATQEVEIRRIIVQSQIGQIVQKTLSQKNPAQTGLVEWLKW